MKPEEMAANMVAEELETVEGRIEMARAAYDAGDLEAAEADLGEAEAAINRARRVIFAQDGDA